MPSVHFLSMTTHWATPKSVYDVLDKEFHFTDDPCPLHWCPQFGDGLSRDWGSVSFVNPPYGRQIKFWISKALAESRKGKTIVCLIPSRTDTGWWHDYVMQASEIRFVRGRLKFGGAKHNAPFPSAVVVFQGDPPGRGRGGEMRRETPICCMLCWYIDEDYDEFRDISSTYCAQNVFMPTQKGSCKRFKRSWGHRPAPGIRTSYSKK